MIKLHSSIEKSRSFHSHFFFKSKEWQSDSTLIFGFSFHPLYTDTPTRAHRAYRQWPHQRNAGINYRLQNFNNYRIWHHVSPPSPSPTPFSFSESLLPAAFSDESRQSNFGNDFRYYFEIDSMIFSSSLFDTDSTKKLQDVLHEFCATESTHKFHPDGVSILQIVFHLILDKKSMTTTPPKNQEPIQCVYCCCLYATVQTHSHLTQSWRWCYSRRLSPSPI